MSANTSFQMLNEQGWRRGFTNILRYENRRWWHTRRWVINTVIWLLLVNGMILAALSSINDSPYPSQTGGIFEGVMVFCVSAGLFAAIGAIITMQGAIIDEKKSGTAAWIMSKPASRTAFVFAKFIANALALFVIILVIQGAIAYLQFSQFGESALPLGPFLIGVGLLALHMLFYVSLTVMLGTIFSDRGPVIAIPMGILFSAMFISGYVGPLINILPWQIIPGGNDPGLAMAMITGQEITSIMPAIATVVWIVIFISVAIWRFGREEF